MSAGGILVTFTSSFFAPGKSGGAIFVSSCDASLWTGWAPEGVRTSNPRTQTNFYSRSTTVRCVSQPILGYFGQLEYVFRFGLTHWRTPRPAAPASFHVSRTAGAGVSGREQRSPGPFQVKGVAKGGEGLISQHLS